MAKKIKSVDLLPEFLRTDKNSKFLSSTIDQLIQSPQIERLDGFIGSKLTPTYVSTTDDYIPEILDLRRNYQLNPALVVKDEEGSVNDVVAIDDLVNQIKTEGGINNNFDRLFRTERYSFDPQIDWDKFVNYQDYYWLVTGPNLITITGTKSASTSTYSVKDNSTDTGWIFTPDGVTEDPLITLYRFSEVSFNINSAHKFYIKNYPTLGTDDLYTNGVTNNGASSGTITIIVNNDTPSVLYYATDENPYYIGEINIKSETDNSTIDVELDVLGKVSYTSGNGVTLSNGMKIKFSGEVYPAYYRDKEFFVEGVGKAIRLVEYSSLTVSELLSPEYNDNFDAESFDVYPFDNFKRLPLTPEYVTINRASVDLNPWSRYNRWVHKDIIKISAEVTEQVPVYPAGKKAQRPIVEFKPDLKLYNFGSVGYGAIDLFDNETTDVFSIVENSFGYYVDGVLLEQGHRVVFNADRSLEVRNKIYQVNFIDVFNFSLSRYETRLQLIPIEDRPVVSGAVVSIIQGKTYQGTSWWWNGSNWKFAQQHTSINQAPLFDLFDSNGISYTDTEVYDSNFTGNKIFGYETGSYYDSVLGFGIKYKSNAATGVGSWLFKNYFSTDAFNLIENFEIVSVLSSNTFIKANDPRGEYFLNVWNSTESQAIPILQFGSVSTSTSLVEINAIDKPVSTSFDLEVYTNGVKLDDTKFSVTATNFKSYVEFSTPVSTGTNVLFKIYSQSVDNENGWYDTPLSLTNNPLNRNLSSMSFSELGDHLKTMVNQSVFFNDYSTGQKNIRDTDNISAYGTRLIANANPISFAQFFIGIKEHSLIGAIDKSADQYNQFKIAFLKKLTEIDITLDATTALDIAIKDLNKDKDINSPWHLSDMLGYGADKIVRTWTVSDSRNTVYPITSDFNPTVLSNRSVLVYLNDQQLLLGQDYEFTADSSVRFLIELNKDDTIVIDDYTDTTGSYIPTTPTKLGLYPKFTPSIYFDNTYINGPVKVIQGHDGSITVAYNDYRDNIILELEKRIYNNIKSQYNAEILDINKIIPSAFRSNNLYNLDEINSIIQKDFIKWIGFYGINYTENSAFDDTNSWTYNYQGAYNSNLEISVDGSWRNIYKYFYGTDRPHTNPWEMLGFSEKPAWWENEYGPAPYTSGNLFLWEDIEKGLIKQGNRAGIDSNYIRPDLINMIPVDRYGNLISPTQNNLISNVTISNRRQPWKFGDQGAGETAWRRSSYWPFVVQKLLALTNPATYASMLYDPSRLSKNSARQWTYGTDKLFLNLKTVEIFGYNDTLTSGYSVLISEVGRQRNSSYLNTLKLNLLNTDYNLFYKVGGFINKQKVQLLIDAIAPDSNNPGSILPQEDYNLILNISNPVKSTNISGVIIQKSQDGFIVKGYDSFNPYFEIYDSIRNITTPTITIGGVSESYNFWTPATTGGSTGLNEVDTTTARSAIGNHFYSAGQIVQYAGKFYRVKVDHLAEEVFNQEFYQIISELPIKGGVTVQKANGFARVSRKISYGTRLDNIQAVYDLIIGYGKWLEDQGFIFDHHNSDLGTTVDWNLSGNEFLYWTTQNWADNSIITISPFADQIKYTYPTSVVDNIFDSFYTYSILNASGISFPRSFLNVSRDDGVCTIDVTGSQDGIYFATIHSVQKEHAIIFNNTTVFNDTIYDVETGYRQLRMKLSGFRTSGWDGDYFSPGFVYDDAKIKNWKSYTNYKYADLVKYLGRYYSAAKTISGKQYFEATDGWILLGEKPVAGLIPNFDYKINQFEDFYSLDIDNFDAGQQRMAQHLIGYTPRVYFNNIFSNPIAQYKFYQGFIKEKGTKNSVSKIAKASIFNRQGEISYSEEWAFRVGHYGSYSSYQELEVPLVEGTFIENPQIINFVDSIPDASNDLVKYVTPSEIVIKPDDYNSRNIFATTSTDIFEFNFAGYVNADDVDYQIFNEGDFLSYRDTREFKDGDIFWLGFLPDGNWNVLRYTRIPNISITGIDVQLGTGLLITTSDKHTLSVGDYVAISQLDDSVNKIYKISDIPSLEQFTIASTLTSVVSLTTSVGGALFKLLDARYNMFDDLPPDADMLKFPIGTKFWVDNDVITGDNTWTVYEKIKNYTSNAIVPPSIPTNQKLGYSLSKNTNSNIMVVGAPGFINPEGTGSIFVYTKQSDGSLTRNFKFNLNESPISFYDDKGNSEFGHKVVYSPVAFNSSTYGLIFVGAPGISRANVSGSGNLRYAVSTSTTSTTNNFVQEGGVKISSIDPALFIDNTELVLLSPSANRHNFQRFGHSISINETVKKLLVGAPGTQTTGTGRVCVYNVNLTATSIISSYDTDLDTSSISLEIGDEFGYSISSSNPGIHAVGAPGNTGTGFVAVYNGTDDSNPQIIRPEDIVYDSWDEEGLDYGRFGEVVLLTPDASKLFVSSPSHRNVNNSFGAVLIYQRQENGTFDTVNPQVLVNPVSGQGMKFGISLDYNANSEILAIGSVGRNNSVYITFDNNETSFDSNSTYFLDKIKNFGTVYVYQKKSTGTRYILSEELRPVVNSLSDIVETKFGFSLVVENNTVYVGAPGTTSTSKFYYFNKNDVTANSINPIQSYEDPIDIKTIEKVVLYDTYNDNVVEFLEVIDPAKGKIAGIADQELKYKSNFDPATYSTGTETTINDVTSSWTDDHVGELWWDLSTVKYILYEQGSLLYRKNNWGKTFPGSTIDIYEWVGSEYLPSEWAQLADTTEGLIEGISGQPKHPDNSVLSVKPIYNSATNSFRSYFYYWVRNKVTVPNAKNRRISANLVSSAIGDPTAYGLKYLSIIDNNSLILSNIQDMLVNDRLHLNIGFDNTKSNIPKHTEWLLLQENSANSVPNTLLEKKLLDSLIGHDSLGNLVPDPSLSDRQKYGIEIRPRQSMFKNRTEALRNVIEFANQVLLSNPITGNYSFVNLNKQEEYPDQYSGEWDQTFEDNEGLLLVNTLRLKQAKISCTVYNGKIHAVVIDDPGFGYKIAPNVSIIGNKGNSIIRTEIDSAGRIISCQIENPGIGYLDNQPPILDVRPYTAVVLADNLYNGKWTLFKWDSTNKKWIRSKTQKYNTPLYWNYIDWKSDNYNQFIDYAYTINEVYELMTLVDIEEGQYVKIKDGGDGKYLILEKTSSGESGTFDSDYNLLYKEQGTIQISNDIWDISNNNFGFDDSDTRYDQTLYDQTPDVELQYILQALKNDIFINELKINWNLLFFKSVKFALTEQKLLDWAFKTSFINVTNFAGLLDQTPVYKLRNDSSFEEYLREVKPYRTQIRSYTTNYGNLDESQTYTTDFDLSTEYNRNTGLYEVTSAMLLEYPWKSWADNYLLGVGSIDIGDPGENYLYNPEILIETAPGDTGSGATAVAYIASGKITSIEITNQGTGYRVPPIVSAVGGGASKDAALYAQLTNNKIRSNLIGLKFDRTSRSSNIGEKTATDSFICDGSANEFILTWYADPDKSNLKISLDEELVLSTDYRVEQYEESFRDYTKKYSKIVFTKFIPKVGQQLEIIYNKNIDLYNAIDRIQNYYSPTAGMPGTLEQTIDGLDVGTVIEGLPFDYSTKWGITFANDTSNYDKSIWADEVSYYTKVNVASTASIGTVNIVVTSTNGLTVGLVANIISTTSPSFDTTSDVTVVAINTATKTITFSTATSRILVPGDVIEFWNYDTNSSVLDSVIDSGDLANTYALGINPEDLVIDGSQFISSFVNPAPDEMIPGFVTESVGINIYTRNTGVISPKVISNFVSVIKGTITTATLMMLPPSKDNISVTFNNKIFKYSPTREFTTITDSTNFTVDWATSQIITAPQSVSGPLGYTIIGIGSSSPGIEIGVIDQAATVTIGTSTAAVIGLSNTGTVRSAYVTVNGESISETTSTSAYGYRIESAGEFNNRVAARVYNLNTSTTATIQAWFFGNEVKYHNESIEQFITTTSTTNTYTLSFPPGIIEPAVANAIVEQEMVDNNGKIFYKRLKSPIISYYKVTDSNQTSYAIDKNISGLDDSPISRSENIRIYINGSELSYGAGWTKPGFEDIVNITPGILKVGDVIAILVISIDNTIPDYDIRNNKLTVINTTNVLTGSVLRIITFNNHDNLQLQIERFPGKTHRKFKLSREITNDNYLWIEVDGIPLINKFDYEILDDNQTIQIRKEVSVKKSSKVVVTTIDNSKPIDQVLGYRIFTDIFNRTHFKRLSKENTTVLAEQLYNTSTSIVVEDSSVLVPPVPSKNIPGIVIIDRERIEFYQMNGNVLSQLRRATLGTGASDYLPPGTKVIDQSPDQTIPFEENIYKQVQWTTSTTNTYVISTVTQYVVSPNGSTSTSHGITLQYQPLTTSLSPIKGEDQITVNYGGRILRKNDYIYHDSTVSYDSLDYNLIGSTSTVSLIPSGINIGDAYKVEDTKKIWVYTGSIEQSAVNGYVYKGLNYLEPEFTVNTSTQNITLNINGGIQQGVKLEILKRETTTATVWNDRLGWNQTLSLMDSNTRPANFLQSRIAELPTQFYYTPIVPYFSPDYIIYLENGVPLTTEFNNPLKGL
jgi:hypothetical protein